MELRTFCRCTQTPNFWACVNISDIIRCSFPTWLVRTPWPTSSISGLGTKKIGKNIGWINWSGQPPVDHAPFFKPSWRSERKTKAIFHCCGVPSAKLARWMVIETESWVVTVATACWGYFVPHQKQRCHSVTSTYFHEKYWKNTSVLPWTYLKILKKGMAEEGAEALQCRTVPAVLRSTCWYCLTSSKFESLQ